jgi:hypothetical protein
MLVRENSDDGDSIGKILAYQRLDTRGKPFPNNSISLPTGKNPDANTKHSYCYVPVLPDVKGKKNQKINATMLAIVEQNSEYLLSLDRDFVSIEWVGKKFNRTPSVPEDVALAIHSEQGCKECFERTYDGVRSFLLEADSPVEGLIVQHEGVFWKIASIAFDRKCKFSVDPDSARPPVYLTSTRFSLVS